MTPLGPALAGIFKRELASLRKELETYEREEDIWQLPPGISNPAGTLALHLAGNLQHFLGAVLAGTGYVRNRDREFQARGLTRAELLAEVDAAVAAIDRAAPRLTPEVLAAEYPEAVAKVRLNTADFLVHLASHLAYHLGQVDYHRRLVTGNPATVGTVSPTLLLSARPMS